MFNRRKMGLLFAIVTLCASCTNSNGNDSSENSLPSSLNDFLGVGAPAGDEEQETNASRQYEEAISECMKTQGFEYIPVVPENIKPSTEQPDPELGTLEYAKKFGFGISTLGPVRIPDPFVEGDPNREVLAAMEARQREAFEIALQGYSTALPDEGSPAATIPGGCKQQAWNMIYGVVANGAATDSFAQYDDMWAQLDKLYATIDDDPRMQEVLLEWQGCMTGLGYPGYQKRTDAQYFIRSKWAEMTGYDIGIDETGSVYTSLKPENEQAIIPESAEWEELKELEISMAIADSKCAGQYEVTWNTVRLEREAQFIKDNLQQLEEYRTLRNSGSN